MKPCRQPVQQPNLGSAEIDIGNSDLLESQFPPPGFDQRSEFNQ
jgi:hypothetical protein